MRNNDTRETTNYSDLLNDLQMLIEHLNVTINFIKTGQEKRDAEICLRCDGDELNRIRACLHNGGYDNGGYDND